MNRKRMIAFERLEQRALLAANLGHNPIDPEDVNCDEVVAPDDALMVINELNGLVPPGNGVSRFVDVDGDGLLAPIDALLVINRMTHRFYGRPAETPTIDGMGNNVNNPAWGTAGANLLRLTSIEYGDGVWTPAGDARPSARAVSNAVVAQSTLTPNDRYLTDLVWLWGQFIDHDLDLTEPVEPHEPFPINVPQWDPHFDPFGTGQRVIGLNRSQYDHTTGTEAGNPRQQFNQITAFLDGSVVYGSDQARADALRTFSGGKLKTSAGDLLPFNVDGLPNAGGPNPSLFLAGDIRANENAALTAMHTLWVREHNRLAEQIVQFYPSMSDENIYQRARALVTAQIQVITYNEFLPALLGENAIAEYSGYREDVNAGIANIFSTAAYRFGHTMLSPVLLRLGDDGAVIDDGNLPLREAFFAPSEIIDHGIDSLLLGAASQLAQQIDTQIVDDVRNFLFGPPGSGGFDLASLNIQRGRDHGLPDYNQARIDLGLAPVTSFADITSDLELQTALAQVYGNVDEIDVWVGGLAEDHVPGASVGELIFTVLVNQFTRIRDGDRFWHQNQLMGGRLAKVEQTTLADVIRRNTSVTSIQDNALLHISTMRRLHDNLLPAANLLLEVDGGQVNLVDLRHNQTIDSRPASVLSQVVLQSMGRDDRFTIEATGRLLTLPGGIVIDGDGQHDTLVLLVADDTESIRVEDGLITLGGTKLEYRSIEDILILTRGHQIDLRLGSNVGARVRVDNSSGAGEGESSPSAPAADYWFARLGAA